MSDLKKDEDPDKSMGEENTFTQALPKDDPENQPSALVDEEPAQAYGENEQSLPAPGAENGDANVAPGAENGVATAESPGLDDLKKMDQTQGEKTDAEEQEGYATDINMKATNGFDAANYGNDQKPEKVKTEEDRLKTLTARSKLMMLKPFKRDRSIKPIFDKKKIVKQIQKEQMEKYTQKLNFEENEQPDFDDIDYDEEYDDEIDSDEGGDAFDELRKFAQLECHKKVYRLCKNFLSFKYGVMFFSYDNANMTTQQTEIGKIPLRSSFYDYAKIALTVMVAISLFFTIIFEYFKKLGTEKSQSVEYSFLSEMNYELAVVPMLIPFHQFSFFDRQEVEDQIACKVMNKNKECRKIEEKRCLSKPKTSEAYEDCRINIMNKMNLNATNLCINLYNDMDVWKDDVSPKMPEYYQRKYACLEKTGVPKGKAYCNDIQDVTEGGDTETLFNCYRRNGVSFGKEFCEYTFNQTADPTITNNQILECYAFNYVPKGKEFCDLTHVGSDGRTLQNRVDCYEKYLVKDKDYCDVKSQVNFDQTLKECYEDSGYTLDKFFCRSAFPLDNPLNKKEQLDKIYACYESIHLVYPNSESIFEGGLEVFKDREYCEYLHLDDSAKKYECIKNEAIVNQDAALKAGCEIENPLNVQACIDLKLEEIEELGLIQQMGADFCYIKYYWQQDYDKLYECLEEDMGIPKDTSYCEAKFEYDRFLNDIHIEAKPRCQTREEDGVDCDEKFPTQTKEELVKSLWDCQQGYTSSNGEPFPQSEQDLPCYTLSEDTIQFKVISKSKDGEVPKTEGHTCIYAKSPDGGGNPWIEATFEKENVVINSVEFHVMEIKDPETGESGSLLEGAKILIDNQVCGNVGEELQYGYDSEIKCKDDEGNPAGKQGSKVRIEANKPGLLAVCDLEVYEADHDHESESALEHSCEEMQEKCLEVFSSKDDAENKYNCLKRFGYPHAKLAQKCLEQRKTTNELFFYPLMHKYQCLQDPKFPTSLDDEAAGCLNKFDEYSIEHCLEDYEGKYETIGFHGKNKDDAVNLNPDTIEYYYNYGNLTKSFAERRTLRYNQVQSERDELTTQVTIAQNAPDADLNTFMCDNAKMKYVSNPFNFGNTEEEKKQQEIYVNLECKAFPYEDKDDENAKPLIGVHFWMNSEPEFKGISLENLEDEDKKLNISRNVFNEQYFELVFDENFEFLMADKHVMYHAEIGVQDKEAPVVDSSQEGYEDLVNKAGTRVMVESRDHIVSQNIVPTPLIETTPEAAIYWNMPNEKKTTELEQFLGIPLFYKRKIDKNVLLFDPFLDLLEIEEPDEEDVTEDNKCEKCMKLRVGFAYIFEKRDFIYKYYYLMDLFNALAGLGNALAQFISQFYLILVIMFAVQMNFLARQKSKQDLRRFKYESLLRKVPNYLIVIEKLLRDNYMTKEMKEKQKKMIKDKKLESIKIKKEAQTTKSLKKKDTLSKILEKSEENKKAAQPPKEEQDKHEHDKQGQDKHEHDKHDKDDQAICLDDHEHKDDEIHYLDNETIRNRKYDENGLFEERYCGEAGVKELQDLKDSLAACQLLQQSLQERLDEEQNEYQGKYKGKLPEIDEIRNKQLTFWDLFDDNFEKLEDLDEKYGPMIEKKYVDFFNDDNKQRRVLKMREQANFLERAVILKKRISFFGIFAANEKIEHLDALYENMKEQFDRILLKLVKFEQRLVELSNEDLPEHAEKNPQFYLVKNANKVNKGVAMNLKNIFMQKMQTLDIKKQLTVEEEKKEKLAKKEKRKSKLQLEKQTTKILPWN